LPISVLNVSFGSNFEGCIFLEILYNLLFLLCYKKNNVGLSKDMRQ
jgi:hypothetical protein